MLRVLPHWISLPHHPATRTKYCPNRFNVLLEGALRRILGGMVNTSLFRYNYPSKYLQYPRLILDCGLNPSHLRQQGCFSLWSRKQSAAINEMSATSLPCYISAQEAYDLWRVQRENDQALSFSAFDMERRLEHQVNGTKHWRPSPASLPGLNGPINCEVLDSCRPREAFSTYSPNSLFRIWCQLYSQIPLSVTGARCRQSGSDAAMDIVGDQLLHC